MRRTLSFPLVWLAGWLLTPAVTIHATETMTIGIHRMAASAACLQGYLSVNGRVICYTLERPEAGNASNISAIPAGVYPALLRYDHADRWRIELRDVPGRTNVQIHIGNFPADTQGCILVGLEVDADHCALRASAGAYRKLKAAFYGTETPVTSPNLALRVKVEAIGPAPDSPAASHR
jgi:hypothetical protein